MKGSCFRKMAWVAIGVFAAGSVAYATQYSEIQVNARDNHADLSYDGSHLVYDSTDADGAWNLVTLTEDPTGALGGRFRNVSLTMSAVFQDFGVTLPDPARAYFTGDATDYVDLSFEFKPTGALDFTPYQLKGKLTEGSLRVTDASSTSSTLSGKFLFDTRPAAGGVIDLPGSGNWPATGLSTAVALTLVVGTDLSPYMDNAELWSVGFPVSMKTDSLFTLSPTEQPIPEPASLFLLALGALVVVRRR